MHCCLSLTVWQSNHSTALTHWLHYLFCLMSNIWKPPTPFVIIVVVVNMSHNAKHNRHAAWGSDVRVWAKPCKGVCFGPLYSNAAWAWNDLIQICTPIRNKMYVFQNKAKQSDDLPSPFPYLLQALCESSNGDRQHTVQDGVLPPWH